ncbi:leukemia inhibitory factor receptor-like isoform X2 [Engraulis encrasicolus]|uniref:leukemia inhibitory factor receptor-like isoform X2 n=1 Tax=Engraulis encrasicolus TaxID=184585 RepID=UPI002FD28259
MGTNKIGPGPRRARSRVVKAKVKLTWESWRAFSTKSQKASIESMVPCLLLLSSIVNAVQGLLSNSNVPSPEIIEVRGDIKANRINIAWVDDPSLVGEKLLTYDIEIYISGQREAVHNDAVSIRPEQSVAHTWSWVSPMPLQCLQHSVRLRLQRRDSNWTDLRHVTGPDLSYSIPNEPKVYPKDDTVMVNSRKLFCCIIPNERNLRHLTYNGSVRQPLRSVGQTYIYELTMQPSPTGGNDLACETDDGDDGASVFVGYSPQVHNFTCETRNLVDLECSWTQGDDRNLCGIRQTKYTLSGSPVEPPVNRKCTVGPQEDTWWKKRLSISSSQGEASWTLTAKNALNETTFTYTANPRHRVYLQAPSDLQIVSVNSTSARLEWQWPRANLTSLPMQCEAQIRLNTDMAQSMNNKIEASTGINLHGMTLRGLHPYSSYVVKVRCQASEHTYKSGDWSEEISFQTKEDIPDQVDVWMAVDSSNTITIVWKDLSVEKSHGELIDYQLSWGQSNKSIRPKQHCFSTSGVGEGTRISIVASNTAGLSPPSTIMTHSYRAGMEVVRVSGSNGSLELSWRSEAAASCGYILDWIPVNSQDTCDLMWKKIPAGHNSTTIKSAPNEAPGSVLAKQDGLDVVLSWNEIPVENRRGFILEYLIKYYPSSHQNIGPPKTERVSSNMTRVRIQNLLAETYEFYISARTSAGEGRAERIVVTLTSQVYQIFVYCTASLGVIIILVLLITPLCYRKRTWLKDKVYPDIPAPHLVMSDSKGIYDGQLMKVSAEHVARIMAFPIKMNDATMKKANGDVMHSDIIGPQQSQVTEDTDDDNDDGPAVEESPVLLDNPTYNVEMGAFEGVDLPLETIEGYKPQQLPSDSSHEAPCSPVSSYQDLDTVEQNGLLLSTTKDSHLESEDYIAVTVVGSPVSVSSTLPLLDEPYKCGHGEH